MRHFFGPPQRRPDHDASRLICWFKRLYEALVFYSGLALFVGLALLWSLLAALMCVILPRRVRMPLGRLGVAVFCHWFLLALRATAIIQIDLEALDALRDERHLIIAPNHPSLLDVMLIASRLPRVVCIIKSELRDHPLLGGGARLADYICNRPSLAMVRAGIASLRAGHPLLIFPEGTRTEETPMNRFRGGFALIAKETGAPVQTVFIETNSPFLGKGWPLFRKPAFPLIYRARLGERFHVCGDVKSFVGELEAYYRHALTAEPGVAQAKLGPASTMPAGAPASTSASSPTLPAS